MPVDWTFIKKILWTRVQRIFIYFFQDLIQHHNPSRRKSLYFGREFIYNDVAGKNLNWSVV